MAWQRASTDGGPLEPISWRQVGQSARDASLDARIADGIQHQVRRAALEEELRAVEADLVALSLAIKAASRQLTWAILPNPLDLPRSMVAAVRLLLAKGRAGPAPTSRLRAQQRYARLRSEEKAAIERRGRIRLQLRSADIPFVDLLEAVQTKASDIITDRSEGWPEVECAVADLAEAQTQLTRIDLVRKRIREAVAATWRAEDAALALRGTGRGTGTDRIIATHRADDAVRAVGRSVKALVSELGAAGADPHGLDDRPLPRIHSEGPRWARRHQARAAVSAVRHVRDRLEAIGTLDDLAQTRRERVTDAQDTLIDLMRRPF